MQPSLFASGDAPARAAAAATAGATAAAGAPRVVALLLEPWPIWWAETRDPTLQQRALIHSGDGRVVHANAPARRWGIEAGMRLAGARLRAPQLLETPHDPLTLTRAWEDTLRTLQTHTPWLEARQAGRALLQLSEPEAAALARTWRARVGVADDIETAELAALTARPGTPRVVGAGERDAFLQRLPIRFLHGVGLSAGDGVRLQWLGVQSVGELARWRKSELLAYLGAAAPGLLPYLHGPRRQQLRHWAPPELLRRRWTFDVRAREPGLIEQALDHLARSLAYALQGRVAWRLTLIHEGEGGACEATRLSKRPLRHAGGIRQLALFAWRDSGALGRGSDRLTLELHAPQAWSETRALWDARADRDTALVGLLERYPQALRRVQWLNPHASAHDQAWRWGLDDGEATTPPPLRTPARTLLAAPAGALSPAALLRPPCDDGALLQPLVAPAAAADELPAPNAGVPAVDAPVRPATAPLGGPLLRPRLPGGRAAALLTKG